MFDLTELDRRYDDHTARVARVSREGWWRDAAPPAGGCRGRGTATVVGSVRRHLGGAVVRLGVRLQGPSARPAADPAAA